MALIKTRRGGVFATLLLLLPLLVLSACVEDDSYPRSISLDQASERADFPVLVLHEFTVEQMGLVTDVVDYQDLISPEQEGQAFEIIYFEDGERTLRIYQSSLQHDSRIPQEGTPIAVAGREAFFQKAGLLERDTKLWWREDHHTVLLVSAWDLDKMVGAAEKLVPAPGN